MVSYDIFLFFSKINGNIYLQFIEALKKSIENMKAEMRAEAQANLDSLRGAIRALNEKHALDVETIKSESAASVSQQVEERSHQFETERKELKDIVEVFIWNIWNKKLMLNFSKM